MSIPTYLQHVYDAVINAPSAIPAPWKLMTEAAIGGLTDVGFIPDTDHLLVLSSQGRGIFDCTSGERIARDRNEDYEFDINRLVAPAFDQFAGQVVHTAGLHGGGLSRGTDDGWSVEEFVFHWPEKIIALSSHWGSAFSSRYGKPSRLYRLASECEIRAYGFSSTGKSFIIATSSDVTIISRV